MSYGQMTQLELELRESSKARPEAFLHESLAIMKQRASQRGHSNTENSFGKIANTFNELTGKDLNSKDVAVFMAVLKLVRHYNGKKFDRDDFVDAISYLAFAGSEAQFAHNSLLR